MRILMTSPTYPPYNSGLGNAVHRQATLLSQAGMIVYIATGGAYRNSYVDDHGIHIEVFPIPEEKSLRSFAGLESEDYAKFLTDSNWDYVIFNAWQNWATDIGLLLIDKISGRKFIYSHCISTNIFFFFQPFRSLLRYIRWRPYWWGLRSYMQKLDGIFFLSDRGSDSRFDDLKLAIKNKFTYQVIPNCLSPEGVAALNEPVVSIEERDRLIAVGSYEWQKGFDFVLKAYAKSFACNKIPLHIFGTSYSPYLNKIKKLALSLGIDSEYIFYQESISGEELMKEYKRAILVLSGSHTECQPLALIDANSSGTPFIARNTGCIESMPGGVTVCTWKEMARQIDLIGNTFEVWSTFSDSGRKVANQVYHPRNIAPKLLNALDLIRDEIKWGNV